MTGARARESVGAPPAILSPHTLLSGLRIAGPPTVVSVEGTVERVHPHGKNAYLTISGDGGSIDARVPLDEAPSERETVRVTGMVGVRPRGKAGTGLSVVLFGAVEDACPRTNRSRVALRKDRRISLEALLDGHGVQSLLIIGTDRAFSDVTSTGLRELPQFRRVSTVDADGLITAAADGVREGASGIIFARGGSDDGSESLWSDPSFVGRLLALAVPFYTAIGHSDSFHLADSYADQAFTTPTHVGTEVRRIVERRAAKSKADAELRRLRDRVAQLERTDVAIAPAPLFRFRAPANRMEWGIVVAVCFLFLVLVLRSVR